MAAFHNEVSGAAIVYPDAAAIIIPAPAQSASLNYRNGPAHAKKSWISAANYFASVSGGTAMGGPLAAILDANLTPAG
jgi:hypothetical protein